MINDAELNEQEKSVLLERLSLLPAPIMEHFYSVLNSRPEHLKLTAKLLIEKIAAGDDHEKIKKIVKKEEQILDQITEKLILDKITKKNEGIKNN